MADQKITQLTELTSGQIADTDVLPIVDIDADVTKKWTWASVKADILSWIGAVTATFTNKTIDADSNTITNIGDEELKAGIDAAKIADGSVSNTEFQYLNGVTSAIQTQLANKQPLDAQLTSLAALTPGTEGRLIEADGLGGFQMVDAANAVQDAGALMDSEVTDLAGIKALQTSTLQLKPLEGAFVDGDKTKLDGIETGADVTDAANVISALNGAAITVGVVATTDKLLWQDADDSDALKYSTVQDILDLGGAGLTNFTESAGTATGGDTYAALTPTSNDFVILVPNNNGGFSLAIADGTATGGNDRGNKSIDLQLYRTAAAQVASGLGSAIVGGGVNIASGQYSVAGGFGCAASGDYTVAMGSSNTVSTANSIALGSGISITGAATSSVAFGNDVGVQIPNAVALGTKVSARMSAALNIGTYAKWSSSQGKVAQYIAVMTAEADNASSGSEVLSNYQNNAAYYRQINLFASDSSLTATFDVCVRAKTTAGAYTAGETYHFKQSVTAKNVGGTGSIVSTGTAFDKHGDASLVSLDPQLSFSIVAIGGINTIQVSITTTADTNLYVNASAIITYLTP